MYDYRPPRQNAKARMLVLMLLILSVASFACSAMMPQYPMILQCVGLLLLLPMIQITARYLVIQYLYRLHPYEDGNVDFEIFSYRGGARMQLVCRVGLEEVVAVAPLREENKRAPHGIRRYPYQPDMGPRDALVVSIRNGDGDCEILIAPDAHIREALERAAASYCPPTEDGAAEEVQDEQV